MERFRVRREQAVLLVVDVQDRLTPVMENGAQVIRNTLLLARAAETFGMPVLITEQYPQGLGRTAPELLEGIANPTVIEKIHFSAWQSPLAEKLAALGRRQIVVTGMETHVCVYQTVRDLVANGYSVHVLEDAVCSRRKSNWRNGLALMGELGAVRNNTETVVFDLMERAATPEFRHMLPFIK